MDTAGRYLGCIRMDVPQPVDVLPDGMDFWIEVLSARPAGVPAYARARAADLIPFGFADRRYRSVTRARRLYTWLLDRALTFTLSGGAPAGDRRGAEPWARNVRAHDLEPERADHLPYVPVPVVPDQNRAADALLRAGLPLAGLQQVPPPDLRPVVLLARSRFWGPFQRLETLGAGVVARPGRDGLGSVPAFADGTGVVPDRGVWFVRQDEYEALVRRLALVARARARAGATAAAPPEGPRLAYDLAAAREQVRRMATHYEHWCLAKLVRLLARLGFAVEREGYPLGALRLAYAGDLAPVPPGAEFWLRNPAGRRLCLAYDQALPRTLKAARDQGLPFFAASGHNRPDFRLDLYVGHEYQRSLVLDAKTRQPARIWDDAEYSKSMEQIQAYAYHLRCTWAPRRQAVSGAIALYPGAGQDPPWQEYEDGCVALARSAPGIPDTELQDRLRRFIDVG